MNDEEENCPVCFESLTTTSEWPPLRCNHHHTLCRTCAAKLEGGRYGDDPCSDECRGFHYKCPICRVETCFERVMDYMDPPPGVTCVDANGEPITEGDRVRIVRPAKGIDGVTSFTVVAIQYNGFLDGHNEGLGVDGFHLFGTEDRVPMTSNSDIDWEATWCVKIDSDNESKCESRATDDTPCPYCGYSDTDYGCQCELERQGNGLD